MEPALHLLILAILGLTALAALLLALLILHRWHNNRRDARLRVIQEEWLQRLLPVLEGEEPVTSLPVAAEGLPMDAVLTLLRELLERFRGKYREELSAILRHIGAEDFGRRLLRQRSQRSRVRGCALLAWVEPRTETDAELLQLLLDPRPVVRLEAASALAHRGSPDARLGAIFQALEDVSALQSDRVRDVLRLLAPHRGPELATLLTSARSDRARVLLLEALALSGDGAQTEQIAAQLQARNPKVRAAAVKALHSLADPAYIEAVTALATDADPKVRKEVADYSASMCADNKTRNVLYWLIHDADFDVQRTAIHALARHGGAPWHRLQSQAAKDPLMDAMIQEAREALHPA